MQRGALQPERCSEKLLQNLEERRRGGKYLCNCARCRRMGSDKLVEYERDAHRVIRFGGRMLVEENHFQIFDLDLVLDQFQHGICSSAVLHELRTNPTKRDSEIRC